MSVGTSKKLYDIRAALAASIIAADIGWTADIIILKRQTDLWNDVATAIATSDNDAVLHIGVAEGAVTEDTGLEMDLTLSLTILCRPQPAKGAIPEETLWESLVKHVHDLRLAATDSYAYRFRFKSFSDIEIESDHGTAYLGRQTVFVRRLSL